MSYQLCTSFTCTRSGRRRLGEGACCDHKSTAAKGPESTGTCLHSTLCQTPEANSLNSSLVSGMELEQAMPVVLWNRKFWVNVSSVARFQESMLEIEKETKVQKIVIIGLQIVVLTKANKPHPDFCALLDQLILQYTHCKLAMSPLPY